MNRYILERLLDRTAITDSGCFLWEGSNVKGYGVIRYQGKKELVHRLVFQLTTLDPGCYDVLHTCDNPPCWNPSHLFAGTHFTNMRDAASKRKFKRAGESNQQSKLTELEVLQIRQIFEPGSAERLAVLYGVTKNYIYTIVRGGVWTHI